MKCLLCHHEVDLTDPKTNVLSVKGAESINNASSARGDTLFAKAGDAVHNDCRSKYTHRRNIVAQQKLGEAGSSQHKRLRSSTPVFDFKTKCLFCCSEVVENPKKKYENGKVVTTSFVHSVLNSHNIFHSIDLNDHNSITKMSL